MRNQRGFAPIFLLIVLALILVVGYFLLINKNSTTKLLDNAKSAVTYQSESKTSTQPTSNQIDNLQAYTNRKYGYELKLPLNWFTDPESNFEFQQFGSSKAFGCGGGSEYDIDIHVLNNPDNLNANDFLKAELQNDIKQYGEIYKQVNIVTNRGALSKDLEVASSHGWPGAGGPGTQFDISNGNGKIIEIITANGGTLDAVFATFKLVPINPNIQDFRVGVDSKHKYQGDIEVIKGEVKKAITNWGYNSYPILSPDQTKVAYISETKESLTARNYNDNSVATSTNIWIVNIDGTNSIQVTKQADNIFRRNLHWLDNNRLMFTDGSSSVKVYSLSDSVTQTVLGSEQPVNSSNLEEEKYLYNSDYSYLVKFSRKFSNNDEKYKLAIINLSNLKTIEVSNPVGLNSCIVGFGPNNKTIVSPPLILDLTNGIATYDKK